MTGKTVYGQKLDRHAMGEHEEAVRLDAQRYRWLRSQNWNDGPLAVVANPKDAIKLGRDCPSLDRLDAAIDEAMTGQARRTA